jgi:hypothetical protein
MIALLEFEQFISGARTITFLLGLFEIAVVRIVAHISDKIELFNDSDQLSVKKKPSLPSGWAF